MTARHINVRSLLALGLVDLQSPCLGDDKPSLRAQWEIPAQCDPFAPVRIQDLKEELRQTGYRLVIAIHPDRDPRGPATGQNRVVRGGCWNSKPDSCRSAYRNYEMPAYTDICFAKDLHGQIGFRCVKKQPAKQ